MEQDEIKFPLKVATKNKTVNLKSPKFSRVLIKKLATHQSA